MLAFILVNVLLEANNPHVNGHFSFELANIINFSFDWKSVELCRWLICLNEEDVHVLGFTMLYCLQRGNNYIKDMETWSIINMVMEVNNFWNGTRQEGKILRVCVCETHTHTHTRKGMCQFITKWGFSNIKVDIVGK